MLRAFNGECDAAIAKVKHGNVETVEKRVNKCFEALNKMGATKQIFINSDYLTLKLKELYLIHEHAPAKQEEKKRKREIKEQIREEQKAEKEIHDAVAELHGLVTFKLEPDAEQYRETLTIRKKSLAAIA